MQLNLFDQPQPEEPKYFWTVTWECKDIDPVKLVHQKSTRLRTAHAVYTSTEQVREFVSFIQQTYSYNGCHIIKRHTDKPNLNSLSRNNCTL